MSLGFRNRLALFLVATLAVVQLLTGATVYSFTRQALIRQGQAELVQSADQFDRQLETLSQRLAEGGKILSLDYALRQAVAGKEHATVLSALRNFGRRIGAARMLLVNLQGGIEIDTERPRDGGGEAGAFAYPALLDAAAADGKAAAVGVLDGRVHRMVVVPVLAPTPIAWICILVPVDDAFTAELRSLSSLAKSIAIVAETAPGAWGVVAATETVLEPLRDLPPPGRMVRREPEVTLLAGDEYLVMATPVRAAEGSPPVVAVLQYPLAEALRPYKPMAVWLGVLLAAGLAAALVGTVLIARGVTRPIAELATVARRIEGGDYAAPPALPDRDEIGQLSAALGSMARAISEREERIRHQATHDAATGLPNRARLEELAGALAGAGRPAALLLVGIERLREIVNTLGHEVGDRLMAEAGARIAATVGGGAPVARVADTALAVLLPGAGEAAAMEAAGRIDAAFDAPYVEGDLSVDLAVAVGVALCPGQGCGPATLLQQADVALYAAGRADPPVALYDAATDPHRPERLSLMGELKEAIEQDVLALHYQPKLDLQAGRVMGAEALVRWIHPKRGFIPPDSFIPLAEQTGTIRRLSRWALGTAARQLSAWGGQRLGLRLAVNLSVRDLADPALPDHVAELLAQHGLPPERLILEITESAIMGEPDAAIAVLKRLADRGVDLSIDDFGVGQSSFAYLRRLPVKELKIDKSFVLKLAQEKGDQAIVRSIVEVGHSLGYKVTAEGVEDEGALALLRSMGCDCAQGYFIARPLAAPAFGDFLAGTSWPPVRLPAEETV
ncbi:MAG TPA: EAL domain-containing protein [Azospirillaceae bacterium]|nr:EAL domain-containing protein [Azospirillaceae bacterium]